jgi:hypothetical protein
MNTVTRHPGVDHLGSVVVLRGDICDAGPFRRVIDGLTVHRDVVFN